MCCILQLIYVLYYYVHLRNNNLFVNYNSYLGGGEEGEKLQLLQNWIRKNTTAFPCSCLIAECCNFTWNNDPFEILKIAILHSVKFSIFRILSTIELRHFFPNISLDSWVFEKKKIHQLNVKSIDYIDTIFFFSSLRINECKYVTRFVSTGLKGHNAIQFRFTIAINFNYYNERLLPRRPITACEWIIGMFPASVKNQAFTKRIKQRSAYCGT